MENQRLKELAGLLTEKEGAKWSGEVKAKWACPKGFFSQSHTEIVKGLLAAPNGPKKAMSRLNFEINRAGKNLEGKDKERLEKAKDALEKKLKAMKEEVAAVARRAGIILEKKADDDMMDADPDMDMGDGDAGAPPAPKDDKAPKGKKEDEDEDDLPKIVKKIAKTTCKKFKLGDAKGEGKECDEIEKLLMQVYNAGLKDGEKGDKPKKEKAPKDDMSMDDEAMEESKKHHHVKKGGKVTCKGTKAECMAHAEKNGGEVCMGDPDMVEEEVDLESDLNEDYEQISQAMSKTRDDRVGKPCMTPKGKGVISGIVKQAKTVADGKAGPYQHMVTVKMGDNTVHTMPANQVKLFRGKKPDGKMLPKSVSSTAINGAASKVSANAPTKDHGKKPDGKMW